jgi:hypothetical protein
MKLIADGFLLKRDDRSQKNRSNQDRDLVKLSEKLKIFPEF